MYQYVYVCRMYVCMCSRCSICPYVCVVYVNMCSMYEYVSMYIKYV